MSYECSDFQETVFGMFQDAGLIPADADPEGASETADLVIAGFEALEKQRDDLLAALRYALQYIPLDTEEQAAAHAAGHEVIARVKGEQ